MGQKAPPPPPPVGYRVKEKCLAKTVNIKRKVHKVELEQDLSETSEEELPSVDLGDGYDLSINAVDQFIKKNLRYYEVCNTFQPQQQ